MLSLLDALVALKMTLTQPRVTGKLTGHTYCHFLRPMHLHWQTVLQLAKDIARDTNQHVNNPTRATHDSIQQKVQALHSKQHVDAVPATVPS